MPGTRTDGGRYLADALAAGAVAVLGDAAVADAATAAGADRREPRAALARVAARFFGRQPETIVAVTGTSGKSSTAVFTRQLWAGLGHQAASIGTLGVQTSDAHGEGSLTTPDPIALHRSAAELARRRASSIWRSRPPATGSTSTASTACASRLPPSPISAATISTITAARPPTMPPSAGCSRELLAPGAAAVLNADVPEFADLAGLAVDRGLRVLDYGVKAAGAAARCAQTPTADGQELELELLGRRHQFAVPLVGGFQAHNLLAAARARARHRQRGRCRAAAAGRPCARRRAGCSW